MADFNPLQRTYKSTPPVPAVWGGCRKPGISSLKAAVPLKRGKSQAAVSSNIKRLVDEWKSKGSIGTSHPKSKKKAIEQAVAIALDKAGKSRRKKVVPSL